MWNYENNIKDFEIRCTKKKLLKWIVIKGTIK